MSGLQVGELAALMTAILWTFSALAWTAAGRDIGALAVCFIRLAIAGVLMTLYRRFFYGLWFPDDAPLRTWYLMSASGLLGFVICDLCLIQAFLWIGPRLSLLIFSLAPPIAALISWTVGDVLVLQDWAAMGVTLAGVMWVVLEQRELEPHPHAQRRWTQGIALAVLAAVTHAIGYVLSKEGIGDYDAVGATLIRSFAAMLSYAALITIARQWQTILDAFRYPRAIAILSLGSVVGPFAGVALSLVALRNAPAGVVATIIATMPVLILPFSILLHREKVSFRAAAGAVIAVVGVAMLMLPKNYFGG